MPEVTTNTSNSSTTAQTSEKKEEVFDITVEPMEFEGISESMFMTDTNFAKLTHELFKSTYADCDGATFDLIPGTNRFCLSLYFDHNDRDPESNRLAISKDTDDDNTKNSTLRSARLYQRRLIEGDRYHLTKIGKLGIKKFLMDDAAIYKSRGYNKSEIDWSKIVSEVADPSSGYGFPRQLTRVSFIDPIKVASIIWGRGEEGNITEYGVTMVNSIPTYFNYNGNNSTKILRIDKVSQKEVMNLANTIGVGYNPGLNIIRSC